MGLSFYDTDVEIEVIRIEDRGPTSHVVMQLHFDNKVYASLAAKKSDKRMVGSDVTGRTPV